MASLSGEKLGENTMDGQGNPPPPTPDTHTHKKKKRTLVNKLAHEWTGHREVMHSKPLKRVIRHSKTWIEGRREKRKLPESVTPRKLLLSVISEVNEEALIGRELAINNITLTLQITRFLSGGDRQLSYVSKLPCVNVATDARLSSHPTNANALMEKKEKKKKNSKKQNP